MPPEPPHLTMQQLTQVEVHSGSARYIAKHRLDGRLNARNQARTSSLCIDWTVDSMPEIKLALYPGTLPSIAWTADSMPEMKLALVPSTLLSIAWTVDSMPEIKLALVPGTLPSIA